VSVCRRAASVPSSCFRRAVGLPAESWVELAAQASRSAPAVAWRPMAEAAAVQEMEPPSEPKVAQAAGLAQPVASALRAPSPPAEVAAGWDAKVQPREVEVAGWDAKVRRLEVEASDARVRPPEVEAAALDARVQPPEEAASDAAVPQQAAVGPDAAPQPGEAAWAAEVLRLAAVLGAREPRPEVPLAPSARQPVAERPSALPFVCRPLPCPWPGPLRAVRSAHAIRKSRTASPTKQ